MYMYYGAAGPTNYRDAVRHPDTRLIYPEAGLVPWHSIRKIAGERLVMSTKRGETLRAILRAWSQKCLQSGMYTACWSGKITHTCTS